MADYKAIKGHTIETVAGDPSVLQTGDIWYSSTTRKIRGAKLAAGTWATETACNTAREALGGGGSQTAAFIVGGDTPPRTAICEEFNGSAWTESGDLPAATSYTMGYGTQTAGMQALGQDAPGTPGYTTATNEYNGSSWTSGGAINAGRAAATGAGTQTAGIAMCGGSPGTLDITETYDGSSWTETTDSSNARNYVSSLGTQTATLLFYGANPSNLNGMALTEEYNGTSWTETGDMNNTRSGTGGGAGQGTTTAGLAFGGQPGSKAFTESFNGTSWTEEADLGTGRRMGSGAGNGPAALYTCGKTTANLTACEAFTIAVGAVTFTSS